MDAGAELFEGNRGKKGFLLAQVRLDGVVVNGAEGRGGVGSVVLFETKPNA